MRESLPVSDAATRAWVTASALALGRSLDLWSLAFVLLVLVELLWLRLPLAPTICLLLSLLAGGIQKILALRVAFDEALFRHWAEKWAAVVSSNLNSTTVKSDLAALDQTLVACGVIVAQEDGTVRDLDNRTQGALRLLKKQLLAFTVQFAAIIGGACLRL